MTANLHRRLGLYRFDAELGNFCDEFEVIMSKIKEMILLRGDGTKQKVTVLAINGIWAMVRIKGCIPFVCDVRYLFDIDA